MPCKSCLVKCDKSITKGSHELNSNLILDDCPCRDCLVRIMCNKSCLKESTWVFAPLKQQKSIYFKRWTEIQEYLKRI